MTKILITGNGFDLAQGLPTRYADFIEAMNSLNNIELEKIDKNIKTYFDLNTDYRKNNTKQLELFEKSDELNITKLKDLKTRLNNKWFIFFKHHLEIETWIDFETTLEQILNHLNKNIDNIKKTLFTNDYSVTKLFQLKQFDFLKKYQTINLLEKFELINIEYQSSQFQINLFFCKLDSENEFVLEFNEDLFYKKITNEWNEFIQLFNDYLVIFVNPLISKIKKESYYINYHYTFNYTETYKNLFSIQSNTKHLHGKINEDNNTKLVMGYSNIDFPDKNTIPFLKGFQIMKNGIDNQLFNNLGKNIISSRIYIWGHSLDISDKSYLEIIINNLEDSKNKIIILIIFFNSSNHELLKNLCYIFGIERIKKLVDIKKIVFQESSPENIQNEFKTLSPLYSDSAHKILSSLH